jgi:hypothetical protein
MKYALIALVFMSTPAAAQQVRQVEIYVTVEPAPLRKATKAEVRQIVAREQAQISNWLQNHQHQNICWNRPGVADEPGCHDVEGVTLPRK